MKIAIIGCGLIGRKRALAINENDKIVACCDSNIDVGKKFAEDFKCRYYSDYKILLNESDCDVLVVAVINKYIKDIVIAAFEKGKHVIAEKPLGRNSAEAKDMLLAFEKAKKLFDKNVVFKTGFNHRFHPALWKAHNLIMKRKIGKVFKIRAIYGHGGRPGMENEWRASKDLCGGGELLDQGVHIIDLIRWFGGEFSEVSGLVDTKFWQMDVEDNAFVIGKTKENCTFIFQVSWTTWKNTFLFEVFGTDGYIKVNGLGGSYGPETLEFGIRKKEGGKPDIQFFEFPAEDISWKEEWKEFCSAISECREVIGNGLDGYEANKVIEAIYESNEDKRLISL